MEGINNKQYEVLDRRGDFALVRLKDKYGESIYGLMQDGEVIITEEAGGEFYERVGFVSGGWELWLATNPAR
jgi:hypothetical protein